IRRVTQSRPAVAPAPPSRTGTSGRPSRPLPASPSPPPRPPRPLLFGGEVLERRRFQGGIEVGSGAGHFDGVRADRLVHGGAVPLPEPGFDRMARDDRGGLLHRLGLAPEPAV